MLKCPFKQLFHRIKERKVKNQISLVTRTKMCRTGEAGQKLGPSHVGTKKNDPLFYM
jgi:hypothetical protein